MKKTTHPSTLADSGLRYRSKPAGSAFGNLSNNSRSCFKCGKHRARSQLQTIRVLGRMEVACNPSCQALDAEANEV